MSRYLGPACVAIALALGLALASRLDALGVPELARWCAVVACGAIAVRRPAFLLAMALAVGLGLGARLDATAIPASMPGVVVDDRGLDRVTGTVEGPVVQTPTGSGALLATAGANVWVWSETALAAGDRVTVTGALRSARPSSGPGLPDKADALFARGARFEMTAKQIERIGRDDGPVASTWRWAHERQRAWAARIEEPGDSARAALAGIALGARHAIPPALDDRWRRAGIFHVLSVSGLHLAVVAGLVFSLLRRLIAASPLGHGIIPARWAAPPAFAIALAYTLVTGGQVATVRALVVVGIVFAGAMLDRPVRLVDALGAAAIAILVWRPGDLFDPGFQLSFVAAMTLAVKAPIERRGVVGWLVRGLSASLWIAITTAPITAYHFQQVLPSGIVGNLVLTPLLELVALPITLAGLAIGWDAPIDLAAMIVRLVDLGAGAIAEIGVAGKVALVDPALLAGLVASSLALAARVARTRVDVALWIALCLGWAFGRVPPADGTLRVTFVDIGQGDSAIVELPDGAVWLVDAGGRVGARDREAAAAAGRAIDRVLAAYGHARIDLAIVSHPHPDHYLGLAGITVPIGELWTAAEPEPTIEGTAFAAIAAELAARGTRIVYPPLGLARAQAGVELVAHGPRYQPRAGGPTTLATDPVRSVNDNSLAVELRYRGRAILFAGDLEHEGESALVAAGLTAVDVVKVPHHGSPTSSSAELVAATRPTLAVISCGLANQFRFPSAGVVARWEAAGAVVARTDLDGSITVAIDADGRLSWSAALRNLSASP